MAPSRDITRKPAAGITSIVSAAVLLAALALPARADTLQPILAHLRLGFSLKQVQTVFPPAAGRKWMATIEPRGHIERYRVQRDDLRKPDPRIEVLSLGFKKGRLVDIQLIYDAANTQASSVDQRASEWAVIYGEPQREDSGAYVWSDGDTVLRVFSAENDVSETGTPRVELRTSEELCRQGVFQSTD